MAHHVCPLLLAVGNLVELLLHLGGEVIVHDGGEVLDEEVVHYDADVCREKLALLVASHLHLACLRNLESAERVNDITSLLAFLVALHHVLALLNGGNGRGVC